MNAEIISIGTELLLGDIVNTNAAYLSQRLSALGIEVYRHSVVGDNPGRLADAIKTALSRASLVITTGGLGPTVDDVTARTISLATGRRLVFDKTTASRIKNRFMRRHINLPKNNLRQAYIPEGSKALKNGEGTAPGIFLKLPNSKFFIALPGPPRELKPMFEKQTAPLLKKNSPSKYIIKSRLIKITGLPESRVSEKVKDILRLKPPLTVGIYGKLGEVSLKITAKAASETLAKKAIAPVEKIIRGRLDNYIFGIDKQTLEGSAGGLLAKKKKTIAIAESCTGGLVSSRITDVSGSSKYFLMGLTVYSNRSKQTLLGVPSDLLKRCGAVSRRAAVGMSLSVRRLSGADYGLAVTGIAGPRGATKTKPVGLVYIALCRGRACPCPSCKRAAARAAPTSVICKKYYFLGDRAAIKWQASQAALDLLRKHA